MTAPPPTPADVARLVEAAIDVMPYLAPMQVHAGWWCPCCYARTSSPTTADIDHAPFCEARRLADALAPFTREEDRDG